MDNMYVSWLRFVVILMRALSYPIRSPFSRFLIFLRHNNRTYCWWLLLFAKQKCTLLSHYEMKIAWNKYELN